MARSYLIPSHALSLILPEDVSTEIRKFMHHVGTNQEVLFRALSPTSQQIITDWKYDRIRFTPRGTYKVTQFEKLAALNIAIQDGITLPLSEIRKHAKLKALHATYEETLAKNLASAQITIYRK